MPSPGELCTICTNLHNREREREKLREKLTEKRVYSKHHVSQTRLAAMGQQTQRKRNLPLSPPPPPVLAVFLLPPPRPPPPPPSPRPMASVCERSGGEGGLGGAPLERDAFGEGWQGNIQPRTQGGRYFRLGCTRCRRGTMAMGERNPRDDCRYQYPVERCKRRSRCYLVSVTRYYTYQLVPCPALPIVAQGANWREDFTPRRRDRRPLTSTSIARPETFPRRKTHGTVR